MDVTLYVGLSHQVAMRRNLEIIANNIANMNTTAFKKEAVIFQEYMVQMRDTDTPVARNVSYVQDKALIRDFTEGKFRPTDNPLDLALDGKNFFSVQLENGEIRYTRNGHFKISDDGVLVNSNGNPVLDQNNNVITFNPEEHEIDIAGDGTVSVNGRGAIARLGVVTFENLGQLEKVGDSLYSTSEEPQEATNFKVMRGMIEDSNVEPIIEMTNMVNVSRQYQTMAKLLEQQQDLHSKAINRLAQVN